MFNSVADMVNFVASVYRAKATRSTFNKVDHVEFNLSPVCTGLKTNYKLNWALEKTQLQHNVHRPHSPHVAQPAVTVLKPQTAHN